jgi:hypothetical protein
LADSSIIYAIRRSGINGLAPKDRSLVEEEGLPMYTFPPDFINRLWAAIEKVDPVFAEAYQKQKASLAAQ